MSSAGSRRKAIARKLNTTLRSRVGYEVRKVRAAEAEDTMEREPVEFRPPTDPQIDRLLKRPIFVLAPVRSGSTLLRMLLGQHSQLHALHELHFRRLEVNCSTGLSKTAMRMLDLERSDLEHLLWDRVMHRELVKSGKSRIVEKTPSNAFVHGRIAACWPDAQFIFLLRHPLSIATSWYEANPTKRNRDEAALNALSYMRAVQRARKRLAGHTVRYEDLTDDPETTLKSLCAFLDIEFEPGMLEYGERQESELVKGVGDWKDKIRTGRVQPGRELPEKADIPRSLRGIAKAWGYLGS